MALERFATHFNFEPMVFDAADAQGQAVYHTNVVMCVATEFAMVGFSMMQNPARREEIRARLAESGRAIIDLNTEQIAEFAGNALELTGKNDRLLALSARALASLEPHQIAVIGQSAEIVPLAVPTIELARGSVRCMLAGVHLARRAG